MAGSRRRRFAVLPTLIGIAAGAPALAADLPPHSGSALSDQQNEQAIAEALSRNPPIPISPPVGVAPPPVLVAPPVLVPLPCAPLIRRVWNGYMYVTSQDYDACGGRP